MVSSFFHAVTSYVSEPAKKRLRVGELDCSGRFIPLPAAHLENKTKYVCEAGHKMQWGAWTYSNAHMCGICGDCIGCGIVLCGCNECKVYVCQ
eukprot:3463588-Rhodomonas_salina.1